MADLRARILAEEENITATLHHIDPVKVVALAKNIRPVWVAFRGEISRQISF